MYNYDCLELNFSMWKLNFNEDKAAVRTLYKESSHLKLRQQYWVTAWLSTLELRISETWSKEQTEKMKKVPLSALKTNLRKHIIEILSTSLTRWSIYQNTFLFTSLSVPKMSSLFKGRKGNGKLCWKFLALRLFFFGGGGWWSGCADKLYNSCCCNPGQNV